MELQDKVIVVTGAAQGLGRKAAEVMTQKGWNIRMKVIPYVQLLAVAPPRAK